ncbi:hypothetical protein [Paracoccus sp. (in: a-proteobacteria)]|uniref:hypothetical protein n=1 Tax=Paracoccus sp. TaxID=267 RepID=UPI0028A7A629|nr:hypothetical protein [Paracoccus sp. (in: a-proteobacteria)]
MKLFAVMALVLAVAVPSGMAFAQPDHPGQPRQSGYQGQPVPPSQHNAIKKPHPPAVPAARQKHQAHVTPAIGQSAANAKPFQRAQNSRFASPPRGQEYRVLNDHLVLVDQKTLEVVAVVGLLSAFAK